MIRIVVDNTSSLSQLEAEALGHMFMHLAGHSIHAAPAVQQERMDIRADTCPAQNCENNPKNYEYEFHKEWGPETIVDKRSSSEIEKDNSGMSSRLPMIPPPPLPVNHAWNPTPPIDWAGADSSTDLCEAVGPETVSIPAPPASIPAPPSQTDSQGIKWDERIHAKNKAQTASGVWKLGRNLSPDFVKSVMAELKRDIAPCRIPPAPEPTVRTVAVSLPPVPPLAAIVPPPPPPPPPFPSTIPAIPLPGSQDLFQTLMQKVTGITSSGKATIQAVINVVKSFKAPTGESHCQHLGELAHRPDLIPAVMGELDRVIV
jgi:hypothetical protein